MPPRGRAKRTRLPLLPAMLATTPATAGAAGTTAFVFYSPAVTVGLLAVGAVASVAAVAGVRHVRLRQRDRRERERQYRVIYENAPMAFMLWDHHLNVTGWNRHAERIFGWTRDEMLHSKFTRRLLPDSELQACQAMLSQLIRTGEVIECMNWNLDRAGERILCEWKHAPVRDEQGLVIGFASLAVDVTDRHRAEQALRASEQKFRLLAENVVDVIWTLDLERRTTYVSPSVERLCGFRPEELIGQPLSAMLTPDSLRVAEEVLAHVHRRGELPANQFRIELVCKNGSTVWADVTVTSLRDDEGEVQGFIGITRDITEQREAEQRLTHMAHHDPLTDLPNRALFFDRLNMAMARAQRDELPLALLYVDLDGFKAINDDHGHQAGDAVLCKVAWRLRQSVREMDTVARIGGDEFAVIITGVRSPEVAFQIADKVLGELAQPLPVRDAHDISLGASIGVAFYPADARSCDELLRKADQAMYRVKREGKGRYAHLGAPVMPPGDRDD
ncbi:MAG TPA: sensor domain-containing diguanylate cyclase [Thioalkalivibrio sp.]|nr:sensor domain-containing diguanylate cyclase [Thioalkalivibrio sp.]